MNRNCEEKRSKMSICKSGVKLYLYEIEKEKKIVWSS